MTSSGGTRGEETLDQAVGEILKFTPNEWKSKWQQRLGVWSRTVGKLIIRESIDGLNGWAEELRRLADFFASAGDLVP